MKTLRTASKQPNELLDSRTDHNPHKWGRLLGLAAFVVLELACGANSKSAVELDRSQTDKKQPLVGFTAVASSALNGGRCRYDLSYDRSNIAKISKTCPDSIDPTGTTNRSYSTVIDSVSQESLLAALDRVNTNEMRATYSSTSDFHSQWEDYDLKFFTEDGKVFATRVEGGSDEIVPDGLLQIYRAILDGNVRLMQNANDAIASLVHLSDSEAQNTVLKASLEHNGGGGAPPCLCDGNDTIYGSYTSIKSFSEDGKIEQWEGCLSSSRDANDPNGGVRCQTDELIHYVLDPARWAALKKEILAASPLSLAEYFPCGSYLDCPSDVSNAGITINVGQAQRKISWPAGQEAQLPANLQYILSVLP